MSNLTALQRAELAQKREAHETTYYLEELVLKESDVRELAAGRVPIAFQTKMRDMLAFSLETLPTSQPTTRKAG